MSFWGIRDRTDRLRSRAVASALAAALAASAAPPVAAAEDVAFPQALAAVERAGAFFAERLSVEGGYVYAWSPDLSVRRGEGGAVEEGVIWNQPPGTPAVGGAFLLLHEITGDPRWLEAAADAANALIRGQLVSGGWYNSAQTRTESRRMWCYRAAGVTAARCSEMEGLPERDRGTLDDNITQSCLGFLLWYEEATGGDPRVRETIDYGLARLLEAQYPNGAWPYFLDRVFPHDRFAAAWRARLPESWSWTAVTPREPPYLVTNDQLVRDMIRLLLAADRRRDREDLQPAAMRSGDFLLAAQLPEPQRGWSQTYNADLQPVWGRPFEPPSVASRETAGAAEALLQLHRLTGKARYLEGAQDAAAWLRRVRLPGGRWARFYELRSDRPLYVDPEGRLTYSSARLLNSYGLAGDFGIEKTLALAARQAAGEEPEANPDWRWVFEPYTPNPGALAAVATLADAEGRVVEEGWIRSDTFVQAVLQLADLARQRQAGPPSNKIDESGRNR